MSDSDEEFYDASDSIPDLYCEGGGDTPTDSQQTENIPPLGEVAVLNVGTETVCLGLAPNDSSVRCMIHLTYTCNTQTNSVKQRGSVIMADDTNIDVEGLHPGTEYTLSIIRAAENGKQSKESTVCVFTEPIPPERITVSEVCSDSASVTWDVPAGDVHGYVVTCCCDGESGQKQTTNANNLTLKSLKPGMKYSLSVSTQLKNRQISKPVVTSFHTKSHLESLLENLGLEEHYREKLSLSTMLQINKKTITDDPAKCHSDLPWYFLKKLMMANVTARNMKCTSVCESKGNASSGDIELDLDNLINNSNSGDTINPLDIVTALFLCSDGFVQQEMALKMSMCQFSVPLLLPNSDTQQCTLMLWAMRDIVKKYRCQSLSESKGFIENRIILSEIPLVSFVRMGECSLSKSEILNKALSNSQQYHDTFVHRNMECGDSPRTISNGLTEISWYLPCGNKNIDLFGEPVAVANLRGDIASFEMQYSFLCQTSSAVFVFFDNLESGCELLTNQHNKAQMFLVANQQSKYFNLHALKRVATELGLTNHNIILKTKQMNDADFVKTLRKTVRDVVENSKTKMQVEQMADVAYELGVLVDEDCPECQRAKQNADAITAEIEDILQYKEAQLPLQGHVWKELTRLEREECRLQKAGSENIEMYKSKLQEQKIKLRKEQNSYEMSNAMTYFINAISSSGIERSYFMKWMRMNLDNLSREKLSGLREEYKEKCKNSENKEEIKDIDKKISNSSLGIEHFFREMGQIYEAAVSLPENDPSRQQMQHLPKLCAELLLNGFPLELVDGDASNIPVTWVTDVLAQLNDLVSPKNKILVVTVLGVQSTGKSTLLNTMFGVQFAVSSGRCTRGAFMLLIKLNEDLKEELNCDFMVIIDTEGLKSPELAQLDNSYEHDNELATLVVGLSDVTIINIAMENSTEMKDILQIVVHAFLRMKEVGKKPKCLFVHQNVSDVSAHDKNLRDRKLLLQQLNEMTQAAAKMEKREENQRFTDVMEYNPDTGNWYIPGLWNGNPPMAPVNAGYSEAVYDLKKNITQILGDCESSEILEFTKWITSLWNAVKHENFIFSFRNSLVADAYIRLCTEFNKWEWEFKKHMYTWVRKAETRISNFGTAADESETSDREFLTYLESEACKEVSQWERTLLENLKQYFEQKECHVYLVEGYKEEFTNSAKSLGREIQRSVFNQLHTAAEIRQGMTELDKIKETHTKELEAKVCDLIHECQKRNVKLTEKELDEEFDHLWDKTVKTLAFAKLKALNVFTETFHQLRANLKNKGSHASELFTQKSLEICGSEPFKYTAKGCLNKLKHTVSQWLNLEDHVQRMADSIIAACTQFVKEKVERRTNYHDTYIQEILHMIDEKLKNNPDVQVDTEFEVSLKQHICAYAARHFQKLHDDFIQTNDPYRCLNQNKEKFRADFKDLFHERDQCQKKAQEFTDRCLRPAVEDFVNRSLGPDIIGEMLTCQQFSTRIFFQYSILLDLLMEDSFKEYLHHILSYEKYVKNWIFDQMVEHFSNGSTKFEMENRHLQTTIRSIQDAIKKARNDKNGNLVKFVEDFCKELGDKLVISQDALGAFMILNNADKEQFADWLTECVGDMEEVLRKKCQKTDIKIKLEELHIKPQNELFTRVIGCGKQCPLCKAPCEAGGQAHTKHWASIHRPKGLGKFRWENSEKLTTDICSSSVISDISFRCHATNYKWHPYKKYAEIFPDWKIPPDGSLEASDYWKYVMTKFNKRFAKKYHANPADIPPTWKTITQKQAKESLKQSFAVK